MPMLFTIVYDDNHQLRHFFNRFEAYRSKIEKDISERLPTLVSCQSYKIKYAGKLKHQGRKIEEYKIPLTSSLNCRVAFTVCDRVIKIIYISDIIRKNSYCKLLANTNLVD